MLVNKQNIQALFVGLMATFNKAFTAAPSQWQKVAMLVPSTTALNDYSWLSNFPAMREWIGDKVIKSLEAFDYTIKNKDWESTIRVKRNDIEDDNLGNYKIQAEGAGNSAAQLPDEIVFALLGNGFVNKCYDGQYFFDSDHPVKKKDGSITSVSNVTNLKLSVATLSAAQSSLGAAEVALFKMKDDEERSLNVRPNVLVVGANQMTVAQTLMTTDRLEDGKPNPYKGKYEVVADGRLPDNFWALMDATKPVKPIIYQQRKKPELVQQTGMDSDAVFLRGEYLFGAEARGNGGYGFWQLAYGSTGTTDPV
ncbi:Mu-like prophage major head subunit gpT family protein [Pseudoduganella sp. RAF53_2]|uniref:Mu-like prophage major head subunit gpT family protein n=1 Tax=unclassified Pseudoduganella TaxID=2637179 RepID=UPI003F954A24